MNAKNTNNPAALIPRPASVLDKVEPGAKRVLALMVSETLAIAQKHLTPVTATQTKGEVESWYLQGRAYYLGKGVSRDHQEAVRWFRRAAEHDHAAAQNNLGVCYQCGEGVPQDYSEAVKWYRKAAEKGDTDGQTNLGACYGSGKGVPKYPTEAVRWYRMAAEQGNAAAQYNLGLYYDNGRGVQQDYTEAAKWYRKAAEQGLSLIHI